MTRSGPVAMKTSTPARAADLPLEYNAVDITAETLVRHCTDSMSAYKRPRWIEFLDELPKTATGKIQRFRLP